MQGRRNSPIPLGPRDRLQIRLNSYALQFQNVICDAGPAQPMSDLYKMECADALLRLPTGFGPQKFNTTRASTDAVKNLLPRREPRGESPYSYHSVMHVKQTASTDPRTMRSALIYPVSIAEPPTENFSYTILSCEIGLYLAFHISFLHLSEDEFPLTAPQSMALFSLTCLGTQM